MPKNIEKDRAKALTRANKGIHPGLTIERAKWLTKNSQNKRYVLLVVRVSSAEAANKLIDKNVCHESNIKTTQLYDPNCRVHQYLKCQVYDHLTYSCKNSQRCAHCAQDHRSELCPYKQNKTKWKCEACRGTHRAFDPQCPKRQNKKERIQKIAKSRSRYHAVRDERAFTFKATVSTTQTEVSTTIEALVENTLKRKQGRPTNASRLLSAAAARGSTIMDHLSKRPRPNRVISMPPTSISSLSENLIDLRDSAPQALQEAAQEQEEEL
jgi:hypothetical protein